MSDDKRCEVCDDLARVAVTDLIRSDVSHLDERLEWLSHYRRGNTHFFCYKHKRDSEIQPFPIVAPV